MNFVKIFGLFALMVLTQTVWAGGSDSGGGGLFISSPGTSPVLIDFVNMNPNFQEDLRGSHIEVSEFAKAVGMERLKIESSPAYDLAKSRLNIWRQNSPAIVGLIDEAIKAMVWRYTPHQVALPPKFYLDEAVTRQYPQGTVKAAILYTTTWGAWISAPTWNEAGLTTQAGLIVHEGLRHVQIMYQSKLSDKNLQEMTARIMLLDPYDQNSLDDKNNFEGYVNSQIEVANGYKSSRSEFDNVCDRVNKLAKSKTVNGQLDQSVSICSQSFSAETVSDLSKSLYSAGGNSQLDHDTSVTIIELGSRSRHLLEDVIGTNISAATIKYINVTNAIEGILPSVYEDAVRDYFYTSGFTKVTGSIFSGNLRAANKLLSTLEKYNKELLERGAVIN